MTIGGVALADHYRAPGRATGDNLDDLAGATGLAGNGYFIYSPYHECDTFWMDTDGSGAATVQLDFTPIAVSLGPALDGVPLPRSASAGFQYVQGSRKLEFRGLTRNLAGARLVVGYQTWYCGGSK